MNRLLLVLLIAIIAIQVSAQTLSKRVVYNDTAKYRSLTAVHAGAGKMGFTELIGRQALSTNFLYQHAHLPIYKEQLPEPSVLRCGH